MGNKLYIVGIGPGKKELIHNEALKIIENSDVLIGGRRNLDSFFDLKKEHITIENNLEMVLSYIEESIGCKKIAVLASGDPGLYGIMDYLKDRVKNAEIEVLPGISALQYLCSKIKLAWNGIVTASVHGRNEDIVCKVKNSEVVAVFTGGENTPDYICRKLIGVGLCNIEVIVGENLSYPDEKITVGKPEELQNMTFSCLSLMLIINKDYKNGHNTGWPYNTPGIPDDMFLRGNVPMTKEEIRAAAISKLRLENGSILYDIGAGTGSVSVECGILLQKGRVYAVEKDSEGIELINKNIEKFGLKNVYNVKGEAPKVLDELPIPDRAFIGGSGGNLDSILSWLERNCGFVRVVINSVTIETTYEAVKGLEKYGFENIEIVNIGVSKGKSVSGKHIMQALNPVYIISAERGAK